MNDFLFGAADLIEHLKTKATLSSVPKTAMVCFSPSIAAQLSKTESTRTESALGAKWSYIGKDLMLVSGFGLGSPAAAAKMEEMKHLGVRRVVFIGTAGSLHRELEPGSVLIPNKALSAEGTSKHYAEGPYLPDEEWMNTVIAGLKKGGVQLRVGSVWSTDAPYREKRSEMTKLQLQGVMAVDMEAAAMFASAKALGMAAAGVFVISDDLSGGRWIPHFGSPQLRERFQVTAETLLRYLAGRPGMVRGTL